MRVELLLTLFLVGCVNHIAPYKPKRRTYDLPVAHTASNGALTSGSLFDDHGSAARLMTDARAQQVNDVVIIVIDEQATAQRDMSNSTSRKDEQTAQLTEILGFMKEISGDHPNFDPTQALNVAMESTYEGKGSTTRNDRLQATVPAMVRKVLPNGDLFVEGHRVVLVNEEEHHFYISGVIRKDDIDGLGQVSSARMADAQIEFVGRGNLTSGTSKGWFSRVLDFIWPF